MLKYDLFCFNKSSQKCNIILNPFWDVYDKVYRMRKGSVG